MTQTIIKSVTRDELYQQVWATPMIKLAERYGVSDVGLAKACKRHKIPRPPRGHWAKLEFGKSVVQTPLPLCTDSTLETIRLEQAGICGTKRAINDPDIARLSKLRDARIPKVTVAERLTSPHPLVAATKRRLDCGKPDDDDGLIYVAQGEILPVRVGRKTVGRAMRIFDAIIKHWETLQDTPSVGTIGYEKRHMVIFKVADDAIGVTLRELTVRHVQEPKKNDRFGWRTTTHSPSGRLQISIHGSYGSGIRSNWSDGKRQRLEELLDAFVEAVIRHIDYAKYKRLDRECEARQEMKAKARRKIAKRVKKEEKNRRKQLARDVRRWHQAKDFRRYLDAVEEGQSLTRPASDGQAQAELWFVWARWYADVVDPLVEAGPSPLDSGASEPENVRFEELDLTSTARQVLASLSVSDSDSLCWLTRKDVENACTSRQWGTWSEVCRVLEGLGYDTSDRNYWL